MVRQWGLEDLKTLLDYVYFETEPMQQAHRGETLVFSKIQIEQGPASRGAGLAFSDEFISDLRDRWDQPRNPPATSSKEKATPEEPVYDEVYDEVYEEALKLMADEEGTTPGIPRKHKLEGPDRGMPS